MNIFSNLNKFLIPRAFHTLLWYSGPTQILVAPPPSAAPNNLARIHIATDCKGVIQDIDEGTGETHATIIHEIQAEEPVFIVVILFLK